MEADAVETRGTYWRLGFAIADEQPYGVGLNNWSYAVSKKYGPKLGYLYNDYDEITWDASKEKDPDINFAPPGHSLAVITWGELGGAGLFIFTLLWLRWFQMGSTFLLGRLNTDPMHRVGIGLLFGTGGIFLQSLTEWTYRQTPIMMTFHAMMGALAALYYARSQRKKFPEHAVESEWESAVADLPLSTARMR